MKTLVVIIAAGMLCASCSKSQVNTSSVLFGKYELRRVYGGFSYRDSVYKPGKGTIYQLTSDSTYRHYTSGTQDAMGIFHIKVNTDPTSSGFEPNLIFFNNTQYGEAFSRNGNQITIGTSADDGIALDFEKIAGE